MSETPENTPDPNAARFDEWASTPAQPEQPSLQATPQAPAAIQPGASPYAQPDIDAETAAFVQQRELQLRRELDATLQQHHQSTQTDMTRATLWSQFQDTYPDFRGEDDFVAASFQAVTGGRIPDPSLHSEMMRRVYDHAVGRRQALLERAGFEIVDENEDEGRTEGLSDGGASEAMAGSPNSQEKTPEDDGSTLSSTLVELQGETEFFPDTTPDMLEQYKKGNLRS